MASISSTNCVDCNINKKRAHWSKCLDKDPSKNTLCLDPVLIPSNSTIQPNPSHHSKKYIYAQQAKQKGNTVYGRWKRVKWDKKTKQYITMDGKPLNYK